MPEPTCRPRMSDVESKDYHDYIVVDGRFVGEFEPMYRNCEDPWHQEADGLSEHVPAAEDRTGCCSSVMGLGGKDECSTTSQS
jgi:hypothetical protein